MPRNSTGKWVARAAATGGGRTYRGQRPVNWYLGLAVLVVLGLLSIIFARYEYQHPKKAVAVQPTVGQHWFAGISFDECGQQLAPLAASSSSSSSSLGITTLGNGVLDISPQTKAQAGNNATLGQFAVNYPGLVLSTDAFQYPGNKVLSNGQKCPKGTPDAGKAGHVEVAYWHNVDTKTKRVDVTNPSTLKLGFNSLVTAGFVPVGTALARPSAGVITAVLEAGASAGATTTTTSITVPPSTPSSTPSTTSTTATTSPSTTTATTKPTH